jgi:hypothetical protein
MVIMHYIFIANKYQKREIESQKKAQNGKIENVAGSV